MKCISADAGIRGAAAGGNSRLQGSAFPQIAKCREPAEFRAEGSNYLSSFIDNVKANEKGLLWKK